MNKTIQRGLVAAGALVGSAAAFADSTAATTAITAAQTDALAVVSGLTAMGIAVWGAFFLYKKFFK